MREWERWWNSLAPLSLLLLGSVALGLVGDGSSHRAAAQEPCTFGLGFQQLHELMPDRVGECQENERPDPLTGDAEQRTTGGLLVWQKAGNYTAFTDGTTTWINGPDGLVSRPNGGPPFSWEAPARTGLRAQSAPTSPPGGVSDQTRGFPGAGALELFQRIEQIGLDVRLLLLLMLLGLVAAGLSLREAARAWLVILIPASVLVLWLAILTHLDSVLVAFLIALGLLVGLLTLFRVYVKTRRSVTERRVWQRFILPSRSRHRLQQGRWRPRRNL